MSVIWQGGDDFAHFLEPCVLDISEKEDLVEVMY